MEIQERLTEIRDQVDTLEIIVTAKNINALEMFQAKDKLIKDIEELFIFINTKDLPF